MAILVLTWGLFYTLQQTELIFLRNFAGSWLEKVAISLVPSIIAILAVAIGGMRYVALESVRRDQKRERDQNEKKLNPDYS